MSCLYRTWQLAGSELVRLSSCLQREGLNEGLMSLERACHLIWVIDALVVVVRGQASSLHLTAQLRGRLLTRIGLWLAEARRLLPAAATDLCMIAGNAATRAAVRSALQKLDEVMSPASTEGSSL